MTMMIDSDSPHPLEQIFQNFEKNSGWRLSPQAKIILQEGYEAVGVDTLGLGDYAEPHLRPDALKKVMGSLPKFLDILKSKAEKRPDEIKEKVIGGVFVLQNTDAWKLLFGCTCWPV